MQVLSIKFQDYLSNAIQNLCTFFEMFSLASALNLPFFGLDSPSGRSFTAIFPARAVLGQPQAVLGHPWVSPRWADPALLDAPGPIKTISYIITKNEKY